MCDVWSFYCRMTFLNFIKLNTELLYLSAAEMGDMKPGLTSHSQRRASKYPSTGTIRGILAIRYRQREFAFGGQTPITSSEDSLIVAIIYAGSFLVHYLLLHHRHVGMLSWTNVFRWAVFQFGRDLQTASMSQPISIDDLSRLPL
ncbi:hypothetical protein M433DRAFT_416466 [Acidomyces richmondensis BFW]|nr:hypothetical protein M433DRAFT_416466 [Acidomyces richmondensis BFW]